MAAYTKVAHKLYIGLATDTKPTGIEVGAKAIEYDTDKIYITYDGTNWVQLDTLVKLVANSGVDIGDVDVLSIAAGDNNIGNVDVASLPTGGYQASVSITRPNDTNAYAANDVIGAATGSTAGVEFASMGPSGENIVILGAELEIDVAAVLAGMTSFDLHLYNVTPPSALGDNAAFDLPAGDRASYLGKVSLGIPADLGSTLYVEQNGVLKPVKLSGTSLFGYLVTVGAYTPAALSVFKVTLHTSRI